MPASFVFCFLLILTRLDESSGLAYNDAATPLVGSAVMQSLFRLFHVLRNASYMECTS